jgi:MFS family permease
MVYHSLTEYVKQELKENYSLEQVKRDLIAKGFLEEDVDRAIYSVTKNIKYEQEQSLRVKNKIFSTKESLDRIAYGFGNQQAINILFSLTGASLFLIGLVNGIKSIISTVYSNILQEYNKLHTISKKFIAIMGILFGLSFMLLALAATIHSVPLFMVALILGAIGVVGHGDIYAKFLNEHLRSEQKNSFLRRASYFGMIITLIALLISGIVMDVFPVSGAFKVHLFGKDLPLFGYLLAFEIAAIMFIISGYVITFIEDTRKKQQYAFRTFLSEHIKEIKQSMNIFTKNKVVFLLFLATTITGIAQVLGTTYYGIFIYNHFNHTGLGGFLNVAVIFMIAILVAFLGPSITKFISRHVGEAPMLVFGTLLIALLNLVLAFNPNLYAVGAGIALATIGGAIVGVAQGLMTLKIMSTDERKMYFAALSFVMVIPFLILVPIGGLIAQLYGLQMLFLCLSLVLALIVAPIYFIIVLMRNNAELII